jgi:hypothetical protein
MSDSKNQPPNLVSHKAHCAICAHPQCAEIERQFVMWERVENIVTEFKLGNRSSAYRHAHALGLFAKRGRNLQIPLGRLIERIDEVEPTASGIVQAIALFGRINSRGELVSRDELPGLHELFAKMTRDEYKRYAESNVLPSWFPKLKGSEGSQGSAGDENE